MQEIIERLEGGEFIIIVDDKTRENEADLMLAAQFITKEKMTFMINNCSGIVCVPMTAQRAQKLGLRAMVEQNTDTFQTPFLVSVDAKDCQDAGVSSVDRVNTVKALVEGSNEDLSKPGHIFPLQAKENGLQDRQGHTEASVDLCRLANLKPIAVICELMNNDGSMMRGEELKTFSNQHKIPLVHIHDIMEWMQ